MAPTAKTTINLEVSGLRSTEMEDIQTLPLYMPTVLLCFAWLLLVVII